MKLEYFQLLYIFFQTLAVQLIMPQAGIQSDSSKPHNSTTVGRWSFLVVSWNDLLSSRQGPSADCSFLCVFLK